MKLIYTIKFKDNSYLEIYKTSKNYLNDIESYLYDVYDYIFRYHKNNLFYIRNNQTLVNEHEDSIFNKNYLELRYIDKYYDCNNLIEYLEVFNLFDVGGYKLFNYDNYNSISKYVIKGIDKKLDNIQDLKVRNIKNIVFENKEVELNY